jgi:hypothetical protein
MFNLFSQRRGRRNRVVSHFEALESRTVLSVISVISTPGPSGSVDLKFLGTTGDDAVYIFMNAERKVSVTGNAGDTFKVNGGPEQSTLRFDRLNNVTMLLGAGNDSGLIHDVSLNRFVLQDGATADESNRYFVNSFARDVRIERVDASFRLGVAELSFQVNSGKSMSMESLAVRLKETSSSRVSLASFSRSTLVVDRHFSIDAGARDESTDIVLIQATPDKTADGTQIKLNGVVRANLGGGNDTFQMIGSVDVSGPTFISGGDGDDDIVAGNIPDHGDIVFRGIVSIVTGEGIDSVEFGNSFESSDRVLFKQTVSVSTGNQQDIVAIRKSRFEKSLSVDVGNSGPGNMNDSVLVRDILVMGPAFFRSSGGADVDIEAIPDSTTPTTFRNTVAFALQSGNVTIGSVLHTTPKVVFGGSQLFVGTDETILVRIAGPILANPARRRLIRAILES